jgi:diguanylate cyclase (GGDEF)-like protein
MFRLFFAAIILSAATFLTPAPAPAAPAAGVTVLHASGAPAIVVGPPRAQRMTVTIGSFRAVAGLAQPIGAAPLGHAVDALPVPSGVPAGTPIVVRVEPAGAGLPHLLAEDPAIDDGVAAARASGVMLGVLGAMLCLQLAGFVLTRDPSIPWYAGFVGTLIVIELLRDGVLPGLRVPSLPELALLDLANGICMIGFVVTYLQLWTQARRLFWGIAAALSVLAAFDVLVASGPVLHGQVESVRTPILLFGAVILTIATVLRMRDYPPARFLLAAEGLIFIAVAYRVVRTFTPYSLPFLDNWNYELSTISNSLLLGMALVMRSRYVLRQRQHLEDRLEDATRAAEHDALTGALNRRGLVAALEDATSGTLFYIDLDGFKTVNDRFGHAAGDSMLVHVVRALRGVAGAEATVARVGGDEFVVVVADEDRPRADRLVEQMTDAIAQIRPGGRARAGAIGASIGYAPMTGLTFDNAMRIADANSYRTKTYKQALSGTTA